MDCSNIINSIGLGLNIIGVIVLFKYGLPSKMHMPPKFLLEIGLTKEEKQENENIKCWAHIGLFLLLIGSILQLSSNFYNKFYF